MLQSVKQAIAQLANIKSVDSRFDFPCPVCWFGNLDTKKPLILTMGINPSDEEFENGQFRGFIGNYANPQDCLDAYNMYFDSANANPYKKWFGQAESFINAAISRLYNRNASFYTSKLSAGDYQLLHVDLFPFATKPTWSRIKNSFNLSLSQLFSLYGEDLLCEIIDYLQTKAGRRIDKVIVFGKDIAEVLINGNYVQVLVDLGLFPSKCNSPRYIKKGILQLYSKTGNKISPIPIAISSISIGHAVPAYRGQPGKALAEHMDKLLI